jgi:alanine-glyoxylate transaminase / (R)-3-amino-2-methylpropionate-pyruvate transaminase
LPDGLDYCYFVNSGSEANDLALTLARLYTKNIDFLAYKNCYHGCAGSTMGLTSHHTWRFNMAHSPNINHITLPDPYFSHYPEKDLVKMSLKDLE